MRLLRPGFERCRSAAWTNGFWGAAPIAAGCLATILREVFFLRAASATFLADIIPHLRDPFRIEADCAEIDKRPSCVTDDIPLEMSEEVEDFLNRKMVGKGSIEAET